MPHRRRSFVFCLLAPLLAACNPGEPSSAAGTTDPADATNAGNAAPEGGDEPGEGTMDADGDGIANTIDNCIVFPNPDQADIDGNGEGDACDRGTLDYDGDGRYDLVNDNCPAVHNPDQSDDDEDGTGDACDHDNPAADPDLDGVANRADNCPRHVNPEQEDRDDDRIGDACEDPSEQDRDGDGVFDDADNCVHVANAGQRNTDGDSTGDACDLEQGRACSPGSATHPCGRYTVDIVYAVPSDRMLQDGAIETLRAYLVTLQDFFREQMALAGYGERTFRIETGADGVTPRVVVVRIDESVEPGNLYSAVSARYPLFDPGHVALVVAETQVQQPDGRLSSFTDGGVPMYANEDEFAGTSIMSGDFLARLGNTMLTFDANYDGHTDTDIGPYPLRHGVTFPAAAGETFSAISSAAHGAGAQLLGLAFGLRADFRNDSPRNGNLMGKGHSGLRGNLHPARYATENVRLSSGNALLLRYSRFFNPGAEYDDKVAPSAYFLDEGTLTPVEGLCPITFLARDNEDGAGLGGAVLRRNGEIIADMPLHGEEMQAQFRIHDYKPGVQARYDILVTDRQGNRNLALRRDFTCAAGHNRAPHPRVALSATHVTAGEPVVLDARRAFDPDGDAILVEWDVNNDGVFDTAAGANRSYLHAYREPGIYQVVARITDAAGAAALSMPLGIRVTE